MPRLAYLCLQNLASGTPANTHVFGMINGMRDLGLVVDLYAPSDRLPGLSPFRRLIPALATLTSLILRLRRYDVLYVRAHPIAWPAAVMARLLAVPVVQEVNGKTQDIFITHNRLSFLEKAVTFFQHTQYRNANILAAVTPGVAEWLAEVAPRGKTAVIPNGVDTGLFTPHVAPTSELPEDARFAVMVSSFSRWHGIETLLHAVDRPDWPSDLKILLVGDGPERKRLAREIEAARRIKWIGTIPFEDLPRYLVTAEMHLVLIDSPKGRSDAGVAPLKLYEAMSSGRPVIVTDQPYQSAMVREAAAGMVIPVGDPAALSQAVAKLAADPDLRKRMGESARRFVVSGHDWKIRARAVIDLI